MLKSEEVKNILVIGIAGGLAQITSKLLREKYPDAKIIGVDPRDTSSIMHLDNVEYRTIHYTRGNFENLFRNHKFDVVLHLGRMTHSGSNQDKFIQKRLDLSVMGTNRILDLSLKFDVKKVIILSTFHVYGALPDNSVFLKEDAPLKASIKFPDLRDVVEMDQIATNWMWRYQNKMSTVVLRPCNIIGSQINNTMTRYLAYKYAPYPIDYNPMFQFIHEFDMARVITESLENVPIGVYNVATDEYVSIRNAFEMVGKTGVPTPIFIAGHLTKFFPILPPYLIDYLKYSCLISNSEIKKALGENFFRFSIQDTLDLIELS